MAYQRELFGDVHTEWRLAQRTAFYALHRSGTCYRVRIMWSDKLGLELQHDIYSAAHAQRVVDRINARGFIEISRWRRIYHPSRCPSWSSSSAMQPRLSRLVVR